jgi:threonylcarbamoyladenosine tRNA methylthiotransferase MtaB
LRIRFFTLGCKVNQYETQLLRQMFEKAGYEPVEQGKADVLVVNTCTVTAAADKKAGQLLRRLRREHPGAVIALTGCLPQALEDQDALPHEADVITGAKNRADLPGAVSRFLLTGQRVVDIAPHQPGDTFEPMTATGFADHTRAFIKIQDGCDKHCTYCIIPTARGHLRSKPPADIAAEAEGLVAAGFKELVVVGINLALYGADLGLRLPDGLAAACGPGRRVRIGSVDPVLLTVADLEVMARLPGLCPHLHLSLQSGCDSTLERMKRGYTTAQYREMAQAARALFPGLGLTTDLIVGFPGETQEEFDKTLAFVQSLGLSDAHIFEYSPRPGTPAADMPHRVPHATAKARARQLSEVVAQSRAAFLESQIGSVAEVLLETEGRWGYSANYTPVSLSCGREGQLARVRITGADRVRCYGELAEP